MKYLKQLALFGLALLFADGSEKLESRCFARQATSSSIRLVGFISPSDSAERSSYQAEGDKPVAVVREKNSATMPEAPAWFRPGWTDTKLARRLGVSLDGQTSVQSASANLKQLLREEILRDLGYANPSDPEVLPQLSLEFIGSRLIPDDRLLLLPYEDDVTREAAALRNQTPVPYYRGFAEASLGPDFFRLVERWRRYPELRESLKWVGLSAGGVFAALALLFGYLKADHLTHSHYTKRLQTFFAIVLLAFAALLYWLL